MRPPVPQQPKEVLHIESSLCAREIGLLTMPSPSSSSSSSSSSSPSPPPPPSSAPASDCQVAAGARQLTKEAALQPLHMRDSRFDCFVNAVQSSQKTPPVARGDRDRIATAHWSVLLLESAAAVLLECTHARNHRQPVRVKSARTACSAMMATKHDPEVVCTERTERRRIVQLPAPGRGLARLAYLPAVTDAQLRETLRGESVPHLRNARTHALG